MPSTHARHLTDNRRAVSALYFHGMTPGGEFVSPHAARNYLRTIRDHLGRSDGRYTANPTDRELANGRLARFVDRLILRHSGNRTYNRAHKAV